MLIKMTAQAHLHSQFCLTGLLIDSYLSNATPG